MLSILMPINSYNDNFMLAIKSVEDAVSVLDHKTEFIVVLNNISTIEESLVRNCLKNYKYASLIYNCDASNLSSALNFGLSKCNFEYVARVDSDDINLRNRFKLQLEFLLSRPKLGVVGGQVILVDGSNKEIGKARYPIYRKQLLKDLSLGNCLAHPSVILRKSEVLKVGGYRNEFPHAEDYDLWLRMRSYCDLANMSNPVIKYRIHESQISTSKLILQLKSTVQLIAVANGLEIMDLKKALDLAKVDSVAELSKFVLNLEMMNENRKFATSVCMMLLRRGSNQTEILRKDKLLLLKIAFLRNPGLFLYIVCSSLARKFYLL